MSAEVIDLFSKRRVPAPSSTQKSVLMKCLREDRKYWIKRLRKTEPHLFNNIDQLQSRLDQLGHGALLTALDLEMPQ